MMQSNEIPPITNNIKGLRESSASSSATFALSSSGFGPSPNCDTLDVPDRFVDPGCELTAVGEGLCGC